MTKKREIILLIAVIALLLAVIAGIIRTSYKQNYNGTLLEAPATLTIEGEDYIRHNVSEDIIPEGYFLAGNITEEMANNSGLEGYTYFINPYIDDIIYVYQENNTSTTNQRWVYMAWIKESAVI